jgi:hypothetical protein
MTVKCEWTETIDGGSKCCNDAVKGRSYCTDHVWLIYQKGTALATRKKDIRKANLFREVESAINEAAEEL